MKPRIGINCNYAVDRGAYSLDPRYVDAVKSAGGLPMLLPFISGRDEAAQELEAVDGVLFTGGADIDPAKWGEAPHALTKLLHTEKAASDECLMQTALEWNKPMLAICYGFQLLNVLHGGSLHQHLPDLPNVSDAHRDSKGLMHDVQISDGVVRRLVGTGRARVNSYHHQAVHQLGSGLVATATSEDGFVEAIELPAKRFVIGVQWHPERMLERSDQRALFAELARVSH